MKGYINGPFNLKLANAGPGRIEVFINDGIKYDVKKINNAYNNRSSEPMNVNDLLEATTKKKGEPWGKHNIKDVISIYMKTKGKEEEWSKLNLDDKMKRHLQRTRDADLSYPIMLLESGQIVDGNHRLAKAIVSGLSEINVIPLTWEDIKKFQLKKKEK
ncbi:MAG: hypothetical protein AABY32_05055 [Nanoarchaeota archaeon]